MYRYELGAFGLVVLNTNCGRCGIGWLCGAGSPQDSWLRQDLADHRGSLHCRVLDHQPLFSSGSSGGQR